MTSTQEPGDVPDVNVSGSQGVQIGSGNIQYNAWAPKPPLDPAVLSALNPHTAVARLQQLSHGDLVDFFARASPDDVSEILAAFLDADVAKVITTLADINRRKAMDLIEAVSVRHYLKELPEAAEAISSKAATLRWTDSDHLVYHDEEEYVRKYRNGHIFWSKQFGARTTVGVIDAYCTEDDSYLGFPVGDQESAPSSPFGTDGIRQKFRYGTIYSSKHGTFCVIATRRYEEEGCSGGWLGFPTREIYPARSRSRRLWKFSRKRIRGQLQHFEGGIISSSIGQGEKVFTVRLRIADVLPDRGWWAISDESTTVSSSGIKGTFQTFQFEVANGICNTAVYSSDAYSVVAVGHEIWAYYIRLGAEKSWLGFPLGEKYPMPGMRGWQDFETGRVYWQSRIDPIAVRAEVVNLIKSYRSLGFPISEEQPVGEDGSGRIQFFQNGVVTLRDGKYEVWVRPDSNTGSSSEPGKEGATPKPSGIPFRNPYGPSGSLRKPSDKP